MEKSFFEQMGGTYRQEGEHLLPNLAPPESIPVGIWGQRRRHYLKAQRKAAKKAFDGLGLKKQPTVRSLSAEYAELLAKKKAAYGDYADAKKDMR